MREDRRFVAGKGNFVADIELPNMRHVALVTCPYPAARIKSIDKSAALAMPGVHYVLDGHELAAATLPLMTGLDTPNVPRRPLATDVARYAGEWVAAVVADSRALAEDAAEKVRVDYEKLPFVLDAEQAIAPGAVLVHEAHGSNVLLDKTFVWGEVDKDFAASPRKLSLRVKWARSSTVPIETFGVVASWDPWREMLDVYASIQMPRYADQIGMALKIPTTSVRVHHDVDVGGSYGVKRGIKHTVLVGYLARRLGFPVRLIEDRLENMRGGDAHGPERLFDVEVAFDDDGIVRSMKMRALENVGAYAGRSPFQLGKPIGAIVGPYKIKSVQYRAIAVVTNKTTQEAVRGFGQGPTNLALERAMDEVANVLGLDRLEIRRRNMIRHDEFPYTDPERHHLRQRRLRDRDRQGAGRHQLRGADKGARPAARRRQARRHRHRRLSRALRRQRHLRGAAQSGDHHLDLHGFLPHQCRRHGHHHRHHAHHLVRPGPRDAGRHGDRRGAGGRSRHRSASRGRIRSIRCRAARRSAAAWRSCSAARRSTPRSKLKAKLTAIGAHDLGIPLERAVYKDGTVRDRDAPQNKRALGRPGADRLPQLPPHAGGLRARPGGRATSCRCRPAARCRRTDGRVQMYPCFSFEFHLILLDHRSRSRHAADPALPGRPRLRHGDQPEDRARHDHGRHRARHRRGAVRGIRL